MSSLFKLFTIVEMLLLTEMLDHGVSMRGYLTRLPVHINHACFTSNVHTKCGTCQSSNTLGCHKLACLEGQFDNCPDGLQLVWTNLKVSGGFKSVLIIYEKSSNLKRVAFVDVTHSLRCKQQLESLQHSLQTPSPASGQPHRVRGGSHGRA